jgi:hypothetical protein
MHVPILIYLDPSSGGIIAQARIGAVVAAGVFIKLFWHRVLRILGFKRKRKPDIS